MIIEISLINTQSWMKVLIQKNLYVESLLKKLTKTKSDQCVLEEKKWLLLPVLATPAPVQHSNSVIRRKKCRLTLF
jgi:hypothetical protein